MNRHSLRLPILVTTAIALVAVLAWQMLGPSPGPEPESAPAAALPAPQPAPPPQQEASPPPAAAPSAGGLRLHGLVGGGAIISTADGRQRLVAIGREVSPGLRVARIEQNHVVLASDSGEVRLGFEEGAAPVAPSDVVATPDVPSATNSEATQNQSAD